MQSLLHEQRVEIDVAVGNDRAIALQQCARWPEDASVRRIADDGVIERIGTLQLQRVGALDQSVEFNSGRLDFGIEQIRQQGVRKLGKASIDFNAMQRIVDRLKDSLGACTALASARGNARRQRNQEGRAARRRIKNAMLSRLNAGFDQDVDGVVREMRRREISSEPPAASLRHQQRVEARDPVVPFVVRQA